MHLRPAACAAAAIFFVTPVAAVPQTPAGSRPGLQAPRAATARPAPRGRRPRNYIYPCANSSNGTGSFLGSGYANVAAGQYSGVVTGEFNDACTDESAIAGGITNGIYVDSNNPQGGANAAFIGAGHENTSSGFYTALGAGEDNSITSLGAWSFLGAGQNDTVNAPYVFVGAGIDNEVDGQNSFVGGGEGNVASGAYAVVVGGGLGGSYSLGSHDGNNASGDYSFVGAGETSLAAGTASGVVAGESNFTIGALSFVGAGFANRASGASAFVGAGENNSAAALAAVIGGGYRNTVTALSAGGAAYAVIAGGVNNTATGSSGTVGGGDDNVAAGTYATVPGGVLNRAAGTGSFAAGTRALALNNGTFVWSDGSGTKSLASTANGQFLARASGGVYLYSNGADTAGVRLAPGSGTWASLSDRSMKTGIAPLNDAAILAKVASLPVTTWSYRSERGVRHVGPMAQDFYAAFGVGEDDRHITSIDEDGVALAAIKGLYEKSERENGALRTQVSSMQSRLAALAAKVESLEKR